MSTRYVRIVFEPLTDWPYPEVTRIRSQFSARWSETLNLLSAEADHLEATLVVVELDLKPGDLRQDGEIRANARLVSDRARVTMGTRHGPLRYAVDKFLSGWGAGSRSMSAPGWQHNVRAVALTLQALRAVDRYGAIHGAEQYQGFRALPAGGSAEAGFTSAEDALRWMREVAGLPGADQTSPRAAAWYAAARVLHPDAGGDESGWARLDEAAAVLQAAGML